MGQNWQVIAIAQREKLTGSGNKLAQDLFDGLPSALELLLAVPILPKGFGLAQPPNATPSVLIKKHDLRRAEYLGKSDLSQAEQEKNPVPTESQIIKRKRDNSPDHTLKKQKSCKLPLDDMNVLPVINSKCAFSRLPVELLDMIFQKLNIYYVFVLGLQTQHFWSVARRHIQAYYASSCGTWAGKGIICVGEYLEPADYPPNVLSESEKEELQKELRDYAYWDEGSPDFVSRPASLYNLANARYRQVGNWNGLLAPHLINAISPREWHRLPNSRRIRISDELYRYKVSYFYPEDQPWVLRNLTTQEYVRSEAIAIKPEYIHGPQIDFLGFGEVVWSRVCWSTRDEWFSRDIHRGVWAGHRFDITTLDRHKQGSLEGTEWKDVSEEVANEVERIWCNKFGSDWRDTVKIYWRRPLW